MFAKKPVYEDCIVQIVLIIAPPSTWVTKCLEFEIYHLISDFDRGSIVAYQDIGLIYREIGCRVICTAMAVMRVWTEEGRRALRRPTG